MRIPCGCCDPPAPATPRAVYNRPALSAVAYRIGTYASFRQAMLEAIAREPALAGLTTRRSDDASITLLELWAAVADVLTFYQERYANEAFLRTAQFRDSIARLASLLDYRLRPGVAARTWIAFELEAGKSLTVPLGQRVQSVPEGTALPQTYETTAAVEADARWNRLRVYPPPVAQAPLAQGRLSATLARLDAPAQAAVLAPGQRVVLFIDGSSTAPEEKEVGSLVQRDDRIELTWAKPILRSAWTASGAKAQRVGRRFRVFGHDAPATSMKPSQVSGRILWTLETTSYTLAGGSTLDLDGSYDGLSVGQRLLITRSGGPTQLVTVTGAAQANVALGAVTASVTRLTVTPNHAGGDRRQMMLYELLGDEIAFWGAGYPDTLSGDRLYVPGVAVEDEQRGLGVEVARRIERDRFAGGTVVFPSEIEKGRTVLIEDAVDGSAAVVARIKRAATVEPSNPAAGAFCHLVLEVDVDGTLAHEAGSAVLLGNVAPASHGETVRGEVIGGGSASTSFLRLPLGKKPLTYLPTPTSVEAASTLDLRINGVRWREVVGLYGQPADASVYELRHQDDGTTVVQFGDGVYGARPPTGSGNIVASYRKGSGLAGRVPAGSLTTLLAKPNGLSGAINPRAAEGGADPEDLEQARERAPRTVRTFGRAVSLQDFEDLVTASGEVAKACATWVWDGLDRAIHLTVAGPAGDQLSEDARRDLGRSLRSARDPNHRLRIDNYGRVFVTIEAGIGIDPSRDRDAVLAAAQAAVVGSLSFDRQRLGESLHLSDFYRLLQEVDGVVYVDIDRLQLKRPTGMTDAQLALWLVARGATAEPVQGHLRIFPARPDPAHAAMVLAAELASLETPAEDVVLTAREV